MMRPLSAGEALDRYFLEARAKLLDLAAIIDRMERGGGMPSDPRVTKLHEALRVLGEPGDDHAERVQQLFSLAYEAGWTRPTPS